MHRVIPLVCLLVAACSSPEKRIEDNQALYNTYSPEDQAAIKFGQIRQGFDQETGAHGPR